MAKGIYWLERRQITITDAHRRILRKARDEGNVNAYMQQRRPCELLAKIGLLERTGIMSMKITAAGKAEISDTVG